METDVSVLLTNIKASVVGKTRPQIATIRREIAEHVRSLELHAPANEFVNRFGQAHQEQEALRLVRHKAELAYLDSLLKAAA